MSSKRCVGIILGLALVLGLMLGMSTTVYANSPNLWIGGEPVDGTGTSSGDGWKYVSSTNTLTLNGYNYFGPGCNGAAIYYNGNKKLNVVLSGTNTVTCTGSDTINSRTLSCGIYSGYAVEISGDGSLTAKGGEVDNKGWSIGVCANGTITVSGTLEATGGTATGNVGNSIGVNAGNDVTVQKGGTLKATGGEATGISCGVIVEAEDGDVTVEDGGILETTGNLVAIYNALVQNKITGTGWADLDNITEETGIGIPADLGQELTYKKVQFPAFHRHKFITFQPWNKTDRLPTEKGSYYLTEDVELSDGWEAPAGVTNLCLNGHGIKRSETAGGNNSCVISVNKDSILYINDCGETPHYYTPAEGGAGLATDITDTEPDESTGKSVFYGGYITGGRGPSCGGILIYSGQVTMSGGTIIGNMATNNESGGGGGVYITKDPYCENGGRLTMNGGAIIGNAGKFGGGVCAFNDSNFILNGGTVSGNTAGSDGGGVYIYSNSRFNMYNGCISGNTAGRNGGGVYVNGNFSLYVPSTGPSVINGNTVTRTVDNVPVTKASNADLSSGCKIEVYHFSTTEDPVWPQIGVTMASPGVFTSGLYGKLPEGKTAKDVFFSDNEAYGVKGTSDGEAQLLDRAVVTARPTANKRIYDGEEAPLLSSGGTAENGTLYYAIGSSKTDPPEEDNDNTPDEERKWKTSIPEASEEGIYYVWYKAAGAEGYADSAPVCVTSRICFPVTFKVVNGAWDDDDKTKADKYLDLSRYEDEDLALVLKKDDLPAVGSNPDKGYEEGEWDHEPPVDGKNVSGAETYIYTYKEKPRISAAVTFKVVNGSWDDGRYEDIEVTLNGHEGDTLKLSADQIPSAGSKPDSGYKAGRWDTVPDTETAITGTAEYTYKYARMTPSQKSINNASVVLDGKPIVYDGEAQVPEILSIGGEALKPGTDYAVVYTQGDVVTESPTDAGTYTMTITGKGRFYGTTQAEFTIESQSFDGEEIVLDSVDFVFDGTAHLPAIKTIGGKTLEQGKDFDVRYIQGDAIIEAPTDAGAYTMTITGKGNYKGSASTTFEISKAPGKMTAKGKTVKIKSKAKKLKKKKTISAKKAYAVKGKAGKVSYKKIKASKSSGKFKVDPKTGKITVKKGLKRGTYKLTVRVTDPGSSNYEASTANVVVKIKIKK